MKIHLCVFEPQSSRRSLRRQSADSEEEEGGDIVSEEEDGVPHEKPSVKTIAESNVGIKIGSRSTSMTDTNENATRENVSCCC